MKKLLIISLFAFCFANGYSQNETPQQRYEQFKRQAKENFESFRKKANELYAAFLKQAIQSFASHTKAERRNRTSYSLT